LYQPRMLQVDDELIDGTAGHSLAFNDAWVHGECAPNKHPTVVRASVTINGMEAWSQLQGNGLLGASVTGSTGFDYTLGGTPIPLGGEGLGLAPIAASNAGVRVEPIQLSPDTVIGIVTLDDRGDSRWPMLGYIDGRPLGPLRSMTFSYSRAAASEIAFVPGRDDPRNKLLKRQFPSV